MKALPQSVPDWCFFKPGMDARSYYARLKAIGYAAAELVDPGRWDAAKAAGLPILNLASPGFEDGLNVAANHAVLLPQIRACLERAKANDIPQVILFSGNRKGQADEVSLNNCLVASQSLVRDAERLGVTLVFEMLNGIDHPDYAADRSRFGFELARAIDSPHFKVLYDIYHMHRMGEDVTADIVGNLPLIGHLHLAGSPHRDFPGIRQEIDYMRIVKAVAAAGYTGYWGQEWLPAHQDPWSELEAAAMLFSRYAAAPGGI
jgi:hydroxypyruvate isomerase